MGVPLSLTLSPYCMQTKPVARNFIPDLESHAVIYLGLDDTVLLASSEELYVEQCEEECQSTHGHESQKFTASINLVNVIMCAMAKLSLDWQDSRCAQSS